MKKIIIYTTTYCPWCQAAKEFLKSQGYEYEERNVETNEEWANEMVEKSGQYGVPVIDIEGKIIVGFSPDEISSALS
ncbi:MAG: glutathione S-transferase N-terminal domain-containing protein [Patescibacteria group bacterium]|nr:glutathione S-transferase N-terminal domain-containing protein [Patescibacteria group bacterium]